MMKQLKYLPDGRKKLVPIPFMEGAMVEGRECEIEDVLAALSMIIYRLRNKVDRLDARVKLLENK